jgi:hypothetical protein
VPFHDLAQVNLVKQIATINCSSLMQINDRYDVYAANNGGPLNRDVQIRAARHEHVERVLSLRHRMLEIGADCR